MRLYFQLNIQRHISPTPPADYAQRPIHIRTPEVQDCAVTSWTSIEGYHHRPDFLLYVAAFSRLAWLHISEAISNIQYTEGERLVTPLETLVNGGGLGDPAASGGSLHPPVLHRFDTHNPSTYHGGLPGDDSISLTYCPNHKGGTT